MEMTLLVFSKGPYKASKMPYKTMSNLEGLIGGFQRSIEGYPLAQAFFTYRGSTYTRGFGRMILERIMGEYWNRHFGSL